MFKSIKYNTLVLGVEPIYQISDDFFDKLFDILKPLFTCLQTGDNSYRELMRSV